MTGSRPPNSRMLRVSRAALSLLSCPSGIANGLVIALVACRAGDTVAVIPGLTPDLSALANNRLRASEA